MAEAAITNSRPNILFLCIDALRVFECIDDDRSAVMETYDFLAESGIEFTQMISTSTTTSPCMASIHTGEYPFVHGVESLQGPRIRDDVPLVTEILQDNGYNTHALVNAQMRPSLGFDRGYDHHEVIAYHDEIDHRPEWKRRIISRFADMDPPWFYFVHFPEVHYPRRVDRELNNHEYGRTLYDRAISSVDKLIGGIVENIDLENTVVIYTSDHGESITNRWVESIFDFPRPLGWLTRLRYEYSLDDQFEWIERQLNFLRYRGFHEHDRFTTVDHGFYPYECLVRIPFTITGGPIEARDSVKHQVRQVDIAPTILELAGIDQYPDVAGKPVQPIIAGETEQRDAYIMANGPVHWNNDPFEAIRTPDWKYVRSDTSHKALYNHTNDPVELWNVIDDHPDIASRLEDTFDRVKSVKRLSTPRELSDKEADKLNQVLEDLGYL